MIIVTSFITSSLNTVDAVIGNFVQSAYINLVQANSGVITLLFTFYIMMIGYQFLNHHHHFQLSVIIQKMIVMLSVYGLIMNWQLYYLFVYNIFTNEPAHIAKILVNSAGNMQAGGSIVEVLDGIYSSIINASMNFLSEVNFSAAGIAFIFYGLLVFLIGTVMCVFALLLFIYAKMMMAISLALGPLFILFLLWEPTKGIFSAWLQSLIGIALIPIVTSAILVLMLSVIKVTLPMLDQPVEQLQFYGIAPFLGLSLATSMILAQVRHICSALGGGISLSNLSVGADIARSALQKSGVAPAARALAGRFGQKQYRGKHHARSL